MTDFDYPAARKGLLVLSMVLQNLEGGHVWLSAYRCKRRQTRGHCLVVLYCSFDAVEQLFERLKIEKSVVVTSIVAGEIAKAEVP